MLARREAEQQRPFIQVTRGLLDAKHVEAIGPAVWVFLWCLRYQSSNDGSVLGDAVIPLTRIGADLGLAPRSVREHVDRLENAGYITCETVEGKGLRISVQRPTAMRGATVHKSVGKGGQPAGVGGNPPGRVGGNPPGLDGSTILGSKAVDQSKPTARKPTRATSWKWDSEVTAATAPIIQQYKLRLIAHPKLMGSISVAVINARKSLRGARPEAFARGLENCLKAAFPRGGVNERINPFAYIEKAVREANEDLALSDHHRTKKEG